MNRSSIALMGRCMMLKRMELGLGYPAHDAEVMLYRACDAGRDAALFRLT